MKILFRGLESLETNKLMLMYFLIGSLDILDSLDQLRVPKQNLIDWVYSLQVYSESDNDKNVKFAGFKGGPYLGFPFHKSETEASNDN